MPNLSQMFSMANNKSANSRSADEIYAALSEGGWYVFASVLKEFQGFFLKFDETSLTLVPGTTEYTLPPDCSQIVNLAERQTSLENWHSMTPETLGQALTDAQSQVSWGENYNWYYDDIDSPYKYYGPYLTSTAAQGVQTQKIRVSPSVDISRFTQIAYIAKWLPIVNAQSFVMLPEEGTHAMLNMAIAELNRANNDSLAAEYEQKAQKHLTMFLTWVRARQVQQFPTLTPYLSDC